MERGSSGGAGLRVTADGEQVWRAGFWRGGGFEDLQTHGDDEALEAWSQLSQKLDEQGLEQRIGTPPMKTTADTPPWM